MGIVIKGGRLLDPAQGWDDQMDLLLEEGIVRAVGKGLDTAGHEVYDAGGAYVIPGLVDMHVHLRDPGQTRKEDMASGTAAAAAGGVTTLVAMPNTTPVIDREERFLESQETIGEKAVVHVLQAGALTLDEAGREVADIEGMAKAGARILSEDGKSVMDAGLCREAFQRAARQRMLILDHCEDMSLRGDGCMNEDERSGELGLPGIPSSTEDVITARDIILAGETGARLHLCHMSTKGAYVCLRVAKEQGLQVSGEVCPHHFILTSADIPGDDPSYKMNPPLRTAEDRDALLEGLRNGVIEVISTDHAPHTKEDKAGSMRTAAFGIVGLETSFALSYTSLVRTGVLTLKELVEKMSVNPARLLGLPCGTLAVGSPADVAVIDLDQEWTIDPESFRSKGKNTPFGGRKVWGRVKATFVDGREVTGAMKG